METALMSTLALFAIGTILLLLIINTKKDKLVEFVYRNAENELNRIGSELIN